MWRGLDGKRGGAEMRSRNILRILSFLSMTRLLREYSLLGYLAVPSC